LKILNVSFDILEVERNKRGRKVEKKKSKEEEEEE
jgi:hypothetical protein